MNPVEAATDQLRRRMILLPRLATSAHLAEAANALWEIEINSVQETRPARGTKVTREQEDAQAIEPYAAAIAALHQDLDGLIAAWVKRFLEQLAEAHRRQEQFSAAVRTGNQDLPPINMDHIISIGQLEKVLQAAGSRIDPHVTPIVAALGTQGRDEDERLSAVLECAGPVAASNATFKLLAVLRERGIWCWPSHLARALANAARSDERVVTALREMLSDADDNMRQAAISVLGSLGTGARPAAEQLLAFQNGTEDERCSVIHALSRQGDATPEFLEVLEGAMGDANGYVRRAAAGALGELTPDPKRFVPLLIEACDWAEPLHDQTLPEAAVDALGQYGPQAKAALPRLTQFLDGPIKGRTVDPSQVREAIDRITPDSRTGEVETPPRRLSPVSDHEPLFAVTHDGKQCYVDRQGRLAIITRFSWGGTFSSGRAVVNDDDGGTFVIDDQGREVFKSNWDDIRPYAEGLAAVSKDGKWGFVDLDGRIVIAPQHDSVTHFAEGLAGFEVGRREEDLGGGISSTVPGRRGFIDRQGEIVIPAEWIDASTFRDGRAMVCTGGTQKPNPIWEGREMLTERNYGYIDRTGKLVIPGRYGTAYSFSEGVAAVHIGDGMVRTRAGYIDASGNEVIPLTFTSVTAFKDGLALVQRRGRPRRQTRYVIDRSGRVVLELPYSFVEPFSEGLAAVWAGDAYGLIDITGRWVVEPQFDQCEPFKNGLAEVQRGQWYALINAAGQFVWGPTTEGSVCRVLESEWV